MLVRLHVYVLKARCFVTVNVSRFIDPSMVFAGFSQATALAARAGDAARVSAQEAQLTAQARLAVAMLQRLTRAESGAAHDEGSDDSLLRSEPGADEIMSELEAGHISVEEALARFQALAAAAASATPTEAVSTHEEAPPRQATQASLQAAYLASHKHPYARALRPHLSPEWTLSKTARFGDQMSAVDKHVRHMRGPAAYNPQWQADSSRRPVPRSAGMSIGARSTPGVSTAALGVPFCAAPSSIGPQASSAMRSMPKYSLTARGRSAGPAA